MSRAEREVLVELPMAGTIKAKGFVELFDWSTFVVHRTQATFCRKTPVPSPPSLPLTLFFSSPSLPPSRGQDFQGLFARREKPGFRSLLPLLTFVNVNNIITLFILIMFRCSSRGILCVFVVSGSEWSGALGSRERSGFVVLSGVGRADDAHHPHTRHAL